MGGIDMKQFNLNEYLKSPDKKVITRDGKPVKILCTNLVSDKPVVAQIDGTGYSLLYPKDGKCSTCQNSMDDLFFAPEKKEGWINIRKDTIRGYEAGIIYNNKEGAKKHCQHCRPNYIATVKVEWEE